MNALLAVLFLLAQETVVIRTVETPTASSFPAR